MLQLLPDAEMLIVDYLRTVDDIADEIGERVYTTIPPGPARTWPLVRVMRVGGAPVVPRWLDAARIQIDVFADDKQTANDIARIVQAALHDLPGVHVEGVVTGVEDGVFHWNPDPDTGQPSYTLDVLVYLHPNPGAAGS